MNQRHPQSRHAPHSGSEKPTQRKVPACKRAEGGRGQWLPVATADLFSSKSQNHSLPRAWFVNIEGSRGGQWRTLRFVVTRAVRTLGAVAGVGLPAERHAVVELEQRVAWGAQTARYAARHMPSRGCRVYAVSTVVPPPGRAALNLWHGS